MPSIESNEKSVRRIEKRHTRNRIQKSAVKSSVKAVEVAVKTGNTEGLDMLLKNANKALDQSITSNIHHKNYVKRNKSRLTKMVNAVSN